ncbi:MAG: substrate-binding domain-containing protein, partial [Spirochaetia bacterium]|nr:substrate-binding domain-containing protein [Spirochaetia bacterium]
PDLTAIYTMSDVMAVGACRQLVSINKKVPDDISVIGFDGIPLAEYYCPKLTTVRQLQDELVEYGLDILLSAIERKSKPVHKIVPFEFIQGESVKKIEN